MPIRDASIAGEHLAYYSMALAQAALCSAPGDSVSQKTSVSLCCCFLEEASTLLCQTVTLSFQKPTCWAGCSSQQKF